MPQLTERSVVKFGTSVGVTLPRGWVRYHKLEPGDKLLMVTNGEITIKLLKKKQNDGVERHPGQVKQNQNSKNGV